MAQHQYVDQALSRSFDLMLQEAEARGIMLKLVLLEKDGGRSGAWRRDP